MKKMISPEIEHLKKQVKANPEDIDALKALTSRLENSGVHSGVQSDEQMLCEFIREVGKSDAGVWSCLQLAIRDKMSLFRLSLLIIETIIEQKKSLLKQLLDIEEKNPFAAFVDLKAGDLIKYDEQGFAQKAENHTDSFGIVTIDEQGFPCTIPFMGTAEDIERIKRGDCDSKDDEKCQFVSDFGTLRVKKNPTNWPDKDKKISDYFHIIITDDDGEKTIVDRENKPEPSRSDCDSI